MEPDTQGSFDVADLEEIHRSYSYGSLSDSARQRMAEIRDEYRGLALGTVERCPPGRARSIALTHLQTAKMFAVQAVVNAEM